jgi:shikimate dehydrogenase
MGAVNTVVVRDGRLTGHNTDTTGFARAVAPLLAPAGNAVAVIGAGGVGKAIAFALASLNVSDIRIFDSEPARAATLVSLLAPRAGARIAASVEDALHGANGLVNGTPVGMLPSRGMPVAAALLHEKLWVADAVYSPLITPLLAAAEAKGAKIMTGRELAIYQAADAFELFTGLAPSTEVMGEAFDEVMAARSSAYHAA